MLLRIEGYKRQLALLRQPRMQHAILFLVLVGHIDAHKAVKLTVCRRKRENVLICCNFNRCRLVFCFTHAARHKALPDQLIQSEQVPGKLIL